jgi:hypothetical protein
MRTSTSRALLLGAMLLASSVAHAQYSWIDPNGVRQFSDQPPPVDTPAARILRTPRGVTVAQDAPPAAAPSAAPAKAAPTWVDQEADYRKRMAQAQEADKKSAIQKKNAEIKQANCAAATRNKALLNNGQGVRSDKGVVLSDADRARELANNATALKDCS